MHITFQTIVSAPLFFGSALVLSAVHAGHRASGLQRPAQS